jgi:hypothetical protein
MRWAMHVTRTEDTKFLYTVLIRRPDGKRPLERPKCRWEDNIKIDLQEVEWGKDWIDLTQDGDSWWCLVNAAN